MKLGVLLFSVFLLPAYVIAEDVLPLDAWVVKKPAQKPVEPILQDDEAEAELSEEEERILRRKEFFEEEKEAYKALLDDVEESEDEAGSFSGKIPTASKVFKKAALSKIEQRRIENARKIQNKVRAELDKVAKGMIPSVVRVPRSIRFCNAAFSNMGFPADVGRVSQDAVGNVTSIWRKFNREVVSLNCDFIMMSGLVSRTKTKSAEFLEKTITSINRSEKNNWKYWVSTSEGMGFYGYLYKQDVVRLQEAEEVQSVALRQGGIFTQEHFVSSPMELSLYDPRVDKPNYMRLFLFDFRNFRKLNVLPDTSYMLQMASALHELTIKRSETQLDESVMLMGSFWEPRTSPVYQIISGQLTMEDFLTDAACQLHEKEQIETEGVFSCDNEMLKRKAQTIFGVISDISMLNERGTGSEVVKKNIARNAISSDIFLHVSGLGIQKKSGKNEEPGFGYMHLGTNKLPASIMWIDLITEKLD